jgi:flagellar basal body-associated protein FliL
MSYTTWKKLILLIVIFILAVGAGYYLGFSQGSKASAEAAINSFEECAAAGYPIMESYPEQCRTNDGRVFTRVILEQ